MCRRSFGRLSFNPTRLRGRGMAALRACAGGSRAAECRDEPLIIQIYRLDLVAAYINIRLAVERQLKLARGDRIVDDPGVELHSRHAAVISIDPRRNIVALRGHDHLRYIVVHPLLGERLS